jgi:hypothetical protein
MRHHSILAILVTILLLAHTLCYPGSSGADEADSWTILLSEISGSYVHAHEAVEAVDELLAQIEDLDGHVVEDCQNVLDKCRVAALDIRHSYAQFLGQQMDLVIIDMQVIEEMKEKIRFIGESFPKEAASSEEEFVAED